MTERCYSRNVVRAVREAREELSTCLYRLDIQELSRHNAGYLRYASNPLRGFVDLEIPRYLKTVDFIYATLPIGAKVIEIGLFIPVIPIALAKLGFEVASVEKLAFYGESLDEIISLVSDRYGMVIYDLDILVDDVEPMNAQYDAVLLLAILEHLNGTPRYLMERAKMLLKNGGFIIVEVPNAASLRKRIAFLLKGIPPYAPFSDYYSSDYPFAGHNREYTVRDLEYVLSHSDLEVIELDIFHHSPGNGLSLKEQVFRFLESVGPPGWRPNIWAATQLRRSQGR